MQCKPYHLIKSRQSRPKSDDPDPEYFQFTYQAVSEALKPTGREGSEEHPVSTEQMIAWVADTLNYLFGRLKLPLTLRVYVIALIGASEGRTDWFDCPDYALAGRLIGAPQDGLQVSALKKRIQRLRGHLMKWQEENQYNLVETDRGYATYQKDGDGKVVVNPDGSKAIEPHPTRYRLPILSTLRQVLEESRSSGGSALETSRVSKRIIQLLHQAPAKFDSGGYTDVNRQIIKYRASGIGFLKKGIGLVDRNGGDPVAWLKVVVVELEDEIPPASRYEATP